MTNKDLILSEIGHDYGMSKYQVENFIYLLLAKNDIFRSWLRIELEHESKGDK